ncbi:hypothetical protein Bca4012_032303 [Brassica carinata]
MISAHASGKSQVALIDAKGIFSDTLDHIYFAYCCKLDCNPEIAKLVNKEEVTKAETKDPPRLNLSCRYATQINMPNYLAPFDPTKKKKMKALLMAFRVHLLDRTQSSRNFSIYLTKGSHSPTLRQWFGRMRYLILKKLSPRAESRPELEFLNSNMIFENLARLRLM